MDKGTGYGYVKLLISRDIDPAVNWNQFIAKPYNVYSKKSLKKTFDPSMFETDDLICFPPTMHFRTKLKGQDSWRYIGMSQLTEEDLIIPDYVEPGFELSKKGTLKKAFEQDGFKTYYVKNLMNKREPATNYESIRHLGILPVTYPPTVNRFLTIYWLDKHGGNYNDFYKEFKTSEFYYEKKPFDAIGLGILMFENLNLEFLDLPRAQRLKFRKIK